MTHCQFMPIFGAIEAGGTKFVCGVGTGPDDLITIQIPTTSPDATVAQAVAWIGEKSAGQLSAVGIGSFGPVDLSTGFITSTPKAAWRNYDLASAVRKGLGGVLVRLETDVNAAVLGEARWGAARDVSNCLYLTVGTGIGGGAIAGGRIVHGLTHPEMGHIRIPHDLTADSYAGTCPYHGDCLEGLASGPAIEERWGKPGWDLPPDHPAWILEARISGFGDCQFYLYAVTGADSDWRGRDEAVAVVRNDQAGSGADSGRLCGKAAGNWSAGIGGVGGSAWGIGVGEAR